MNYECGQVLRYAYLGLQYWAYIFIYMHSFAIMLLYAMSLLLIHVGLTGNCKSTIEIDDLSMGSTNKMK